MPHAPVRANVYRAARFRRVLATMPSFPPIDPSPLIIATADGRLISCAVRRLRRRRGEPRWVFTTELHDVGGALCAMTFVGPVYRSGEHDSPEAIRQLASTWWEAQEEIERPHLTMVRRIAAQ